MTAYAIDYQRERITIAADSGAFLPVRDAAPAPVGAVSKVHAFPHLRMVLFARGQHQIATAVAAMLHQDTQLQRVEDAAARLPDSLRMSVECYCEAVGIADPGAYGLSEIYLAGWSSSERRMRLWSVDNLDYQLQEAGERHGMVAVPRLPESALPVRSKGSSVELQLAALMLASQRHYTENPELGIALAGEIVITRITPDGISQRIVGKLPGETRDAALVARINSGDERVDVAAGLYRAAEMHPAA